MSGKNSAIQTARPTLSTVPAAWQITETKAAVEPGWFHQDRYQLPAHMCSLPVEVFIKSNRSAKSGGERRSSHTVLRNVEFHHSGRALVVG